MRLYPQTQTRGCNGTSRPAPIRIGRIAAVRRMRRMAAISLAGGHWAATHPKRDDAVREMALLVDVPFEPTPALSLAYR
jgi:hypothetical protein